VLFVGVRMLCCTLIGNPTLWAGSPPPIFQDHRPAAALQLEYSLFKRDAWAEVFLGLGSIYGHFPLISQHLAALHTPCDVLHFVPIMGSHP